MTSLYEPLHESLARCLGKTPDGQPNGCELAYTCKRHLAIRTDHFGGLFHVMPRMCSEGARLQYIPTEDAEAEQ
jgi:hypothetical protein